MKRTNNTNRPENLLHWFFWKGANPTSYIVEYWQPYGYPMNACDVPHELKAVKQGRYRETWTRTQPKQHLFRWNDHLRGETFIGPVKGELTNFLRFDPDRHSADVDGQQHVENVMNLLERLKGENYPVLAEVNPTNGSTAIFVFLPRLTRIDEIDFAAWRRRLDFHGEIYPDDCQQVYLPLRGDKITVIDTGECPARSSKARKTGKIYQVYDTKEVVAHIQRRGFPNLAVVRKVLKEAVARPLPTKPKTSKTRSSRGPGCMGSVRHKGCFLQNIIDFRSGQCEADTLGCYTTPIRRLLSEGYGLDHDDINDIFQGVFDSSDTSYSDRLTQNQREFWRTERYLINAIDAGNRYQPDPDTSTQKIKAVAQRWQEKGIDVVGFLRGKPLHGFTLGSSKLKLKWTAELLNLVPRLVKVAHCDVDTARRLMENVLAHIETISELSVTYLRRIMGACNIASGSQQKGHDVRKWFEEWLIQLVKKGFRDEETGYSHGNFYVNNLSVEFEYETDGSDVLPPVSILSFFGEEEPVVMMQRRLRVERLYKVRISDYWRLRRLDQAA